MSSIDTMTATTDHQWMQQFYHQQPLMDEQHEAIVPPKELGFSADANANATVMTNSPTPMLNNVSKPIRRRSRASKRTPTTLLNANTTNFRALVQQFTGCPTTTTMSSLGVHKGPITLNFKQGSRQTSRIMPQIIGSRNHNQFHQVADQPLIQWQKQQDHQQLLPQQQLFEEQQSGYSFDYMKISNNNILPTTAGTSRLSMEVSDGLLVGNDFSFNDLTVNAFSNDHAY